MNGLGGGKSGVGVCMGGCEQRLGFQPTKPFSQCAIGARRRFAALSEERRLVPLSSRSESFCRPALCEVAGEMWPAKVSSTVCPQGTDETMGISIYQVMVFTLFVGVMAGIVGTLLLQALWAKVFGKQTDLEGAAVEDREQEGGGVRLSRRSGGLSPSEQVPGAPEQVPEEPEPERTGEGEARGFRQMVYVTPFGKKWHTRERCQGLLSARRVGPTTRVAAERGGYGPCRYCGFVE